MSLLSWTTKRVREIFEGIGKLHNEDFQRIDSGTTILAKTDLGLIDVAFDDNYPELQDIGDVIPDGQLDASYILNGDLALRFEESSGSVAVDFIGGADGTYIGSPTYLTPGGFDEDGDGVRLNTTSEAVEWSNYPRVGPLHTISFVYQRNQATPVTFIYYPPSTGFMRIFTDPDLSMEDTSGIFSDPYEPADGTTFYYTFTVDFTAGETLFFLDGLPFYQNSGIATSNPIDPTSGFAIASDGTQGDAQGDWYYFNHSDSIAAPEDVYRSWVALSGKRHWFYEKVVKELGLTTLANSSAVVDFHLPLIEQAGTLALDVSMNSNHGTYLGTIGVNTILGQSNIGNDALYSIEVDGNTGGIQAKPSMDMSSSDWTMFIEFFSASAAANEAVWSISDAGATSYICHVRIGSLSEFRFYDGTTVVGVTGGGLYGSGQLHRIVCRHNATAQEISLWEDGKFMGTASTSALSMPSFSGRDMFMGERASASLDEFAGNIGLPCLFKVALSDAECISLSEGF